MFNKLLQEIETLFHGLPLVEIPEKQWNELVHYCFVLLEEQVDHLVSVAENKFPNQAFHNSKTNPLIFARPHARICTIEILPDDDLIKNKISFSLYRSAAQFPAYVFMELSLDTDSTVGGLRTLYINYRRVVEILIDSSALQFETNSDSEKLLRYKGKSTTKKLDLYFSEEPEENDFPCLCVEFPMNSSPDLILNTFFVLTALYESTCAGMRKRKNLDKILDFYLAMRNK